MASIYSKRQVDRVTKGLRIMSSLKNSKIIRAEIAKFVKDSKDAFGINGLDVIIHIQNQYDAIATEGLRAWCNAYCDLNRNRLKAIHNRDAWTQNQIERDMLHLVEGSVPKLELL